MRVPYRFALRVSYTIFLGALAACGFAPKTAPANAIVARTIPAAWVPVSNAAGTPPRIVGVRFSSLDVPLGSDFSGDVVTSKDVDHVSFFTNLYEFSAQRTAPGRFHFLQHIVDEPGFIVRRYALDVIVRTKAGLESRLVVPFRISGRGMS